MNISSEKKGDSALIKGQSRLPMKARKKKKGLEKILGKLLKNNLSGFMALLHSQQRITFVIFYGILK